MTPEGGGCDEEGNDVVVTCEGASPSLWEWLDAPDFARWFDMRPFFGRFDSARIEPMRIEQELTDDTLIVRAELPGIDPEKDVDITLDEGVLRIKGERRSETKEEKEGSFRSEFRYGAFERALRVPTRDALRRCDGDLQGRRPRGAVPIQGAH